MSRAIDNLTHEHEVIESALGILGRIDRRLTAGEQIDAADLFAFIGFFQEFVDKCHHGKEEGLLFPALAQAGLQQQGGPVGVLLDEHAQGRVWIGRMQSSLQPPLDTRALCDAAKGYRALLEAHIRKENEALFPMAERMLPASQLDQLAESFEAHEVQVVGPGRHEQLHALLQALTAKYPA